MRALFAVALLSCALGACGEEPRSAGRAASPDDLPAAAGGAASSAKPPEVGSIYAAPQGRELTLTPPSTWIAQTPNVAMKRAQYLVPRAEGDPEDGDVSVSYAGQQGMGPTSTNLLRWARQFAHEGDPLAALTQSQRRVGALAVTECSISGRYVAEVPPGSGNKVDKPQWSLMGAIVESDHGPYYIRMLGPERTVAAHAAEFREFVSTLK